MTSYHFDYTTGNPDDLDGGDPAQMIDIQGSFYDLRAFLNSGVFDALAALSPPVSIATGAPVLDVGLAGQLRAGRQLALTDFTNMGLAAPVGLWNLGDLTNLGAGGNLVNKGAVPFGVGINGGAATAAVFAGSTGQALYIADTGAADPFRIRTGSWGCWARTAKRGVRQFLLSRLGSAGTAAVQAFNLEVNANNTATSAASEGVGSYGAVGVSDVADDRWHFVVGTVDGTTLRLYVDGILEAATAFAAAINPAAVPLNIGGYGADGGTAAGLPNYGRVDEAFVTADVLTEDQVRNLYCAKLAHTLGVVPARANLNVRRRRRGATLLAADFPTQPLRLHNFTNGALTDEGSGGIALVPVGGGSIVDVAGADGTLNNAKSFSGAHTGLGATDAGLPAGTAARSYGMWVKTTATPGQAVAGWGTLGSGDARLTMGAGVLSAYSGGDALVGSYIGDGQWHLVVEVEDNAAGDGVRRKLYVDGRLVGGSTVLTSLTLAGANRFRVGANPDGTSPFAGQIDAAFVTGVALSAEQIFALYAKGTQALTPSPKNPGDHVEALDATSAYVTFDQLDSTAQVDLSVGT